MKTPILIIVENLPVPFDTRVWKEAQALHAHGYEVSVLCPKGKGFEQGREDLEGVHIYRHPMPREGSGPVGFLVEYAAALFWEVLFAWRIFGERRFRVIQGCNPPDTVFLVALPFKLFGVKYIFDHHDVTPELYEAKYGRRDLLYRVQVWLEKMTFRTADVAMATNETYKGVACSRGGLSPDDVFVVRNGPDLERFRPVPPVAARKHGKRHLVGYVGTMSVQEGLDILLEAARIIKRQGRDDVHFTCIGGGPGLKELRELKTAMDLDDIFDFTGRVPDQDLLEILSTADVCVNPDKPGAMNDMSTMIKIMEYMALGKPIVQFDLKEGRYSAGDAALYARSDLGASDFAAQILRLLDSPEQRASLGAVGRKRVEERLAWQYSVPNLIAAYRRCLES